MSKRQDGWYYAHDGQGNIINFSKHETMPIGQDSEYWVGPFDRFGIAKTDAIRMNEEQIERLKQSSAVLRKLQEPGRKKRAAPAATEPA